MQGYGWQKKIFVCALLVAAMCVFTACPTGSGPVVSISVSPATISQNSGNATVTLTLSQPGVAPVGIVLSASIAGGSADAQEAIFVLSPTTLTIPAGELTATSTLTALFNPDVDDDVEVVVTIDSVTLAAISPTASSASVVIEDIGIGGMRELSYGALFGMISYANALVGPVIGILTGSPTVDCDIDGVPSGTVTGTILSLTPSFDVDMLYDDCGAFHFSGDASASGTLDFGSPPILVNGVVPVPGLAGVYTTSSNVLLPVMMIGNLDITLVVTSDAAISDLEAQFDFAYTGESSVTLTTDNGHAESSVTADPSFNVPLTGNFTFVRSTDGAILTCDFDGSPESLATYDGLFPSITTFEDNDICCFTLESSSTCGG